MIDMMIDTDAMVREREAQLRASYERVDAMVRESERVDAMVREREAQLKEAYRRTDEMVRASQVEPRILYKTLEFK